MRTLFLVPFILSLAPLACGDDKQVTATEVVGSSTGSDGSSADVPTGTDGSSTAEPTTGVSIGGDEETAGVTTLPVADCSGDAPRVLMVTSAGDMLIELNAVQAPVTTANFVEYVNDGFYDGTIFHRVIDGFVIQGGGFTTDLVEKPTNSPIALETNPALKHVDGAISMARTDDPNSATSQFYLCDGPQPGLDGAYAVFGVLIEGFEVLAAISAVAVHDEGGFSDVPVEDVVVNMAYCVP